MATAKRKESPDILQIKMINIMELRLALMELSNVHKEEISLYDLLLYIKPLTKNTEKSLMKDE